MRIVVDIRKDANAQVILNQLYQYTQLQDTVGVIMLAIDHKVPKVLTLKQMLQKYVEFQDEVVRRRTQYDLKKAKERAHILEGLKMCIRDSHKTGVHIGFAAGIHSAKLAVAADGTIAHDSAPPF